MGPVVGAEEMFRIAMLAWLPHLSGAYFIMVGSSGLFLCRIYIEQK